VTTRVQAIRVTKWGWKPCMLCGKRTARRIGSNPAPLCLDLNFVAANVCIGQESIHENKNYEQTAARVYGGVCMACAKRLSSRLDAVIEQIESKYD
jgi:hypothetical protein